MYINGVQCDMCQLIDNMNIVDDLPQGWFVLVQSLRDERKHFCSVKCLIAWAGKQLPALAETVCTPAYQVLHDAYTTVEVNQKDDTHEYWRDL